MNVGELISFSFGETKFYGWGRKLQLAVRLWIRLFPCRAMHLSEEEGTFLELRHHRARHSTHLEPSNLGQ